MPVDMKKKIAEAALRLLTEKKARKLTVKDIVEECHITRQSFYYHFEDIPDLLRWVLEQGLERMMEETQAKENGEESIRYFFLMAVNAMPYVRNPITAKRWSTFCGSRVSVCLSGLWKKRACIRAAASRS